MANGKTILVVDDDPGARHLLQFLLAKTGCEIKTAGNGKQALAIASERTIHLLITDLMMEGMDGLALMEALRQMPAYAEVPLILLSARWQVEYRDQVERYQNAMLMTKPFSPMELMANITQLLKL